MPRRSGERSPPLRADSVFVGRRHELDYLESRLAELLGGSGGSVVVAGEPGLGKTALLAQLEIRARARRVHVVRLAGTELRHAAPRAFIAPLAAVHTEAPLVVLADNVDWADAESIRELRAARRNTDVPPLIVATTRPGAGSAFPGEERLELPPLSEAETAECVQRHVPGASRRLERALLSRSAGNPLFLTEMLCSLGVLDLGRVGTFPDSLGAIIESRMTRLPANAAHAIRSAAVLGAEMRNDEFASLVSVGRQVASAWLAAAADADLVERARPGRYLHALYAEYLESTLDPDQRLELHARAGGWNASSPAWAAPGASPADRIRHLAAAVELVGADALGAIARSAAAGAVRRGQDAYAAQIVAIAEEGLGRLVDSAVAARWLTELADLLRAESGGQG